jgi:hypothetical protein
LLLTRVGKFSLTLGKLTFEIGYALLDSVLKVQQKV